MRPSSSREKGTAGDAAILAIAPTRAIQFGLAALAFAGLRRVRDGAVERRAQAFSRPLLCVARRGNEAVGAIELVRRAREQPVLDGDTLGLKTLSQHLPFRTKRIDLLIDRT